MSELQAMRAAIVDELVSLWCDLNRAQSRAYNGQWSMECDSLEERIKALTLLVGPTSWENIQINLLENGVYQRIHGDLGIAVEVDMDRVAKVRANIAAGVL
jgi:hypothetical protein